MTVYTFDSKIQVSFGFAELLKKIFPKEFDLDKISTFIDYKRAVEARLYAFELNDKFHVGCYCHACGSYEFIQVWDIAVALQAQSAVDCSCENGSLLPLYRDKAS